MSNRIHELAKELQVSSKEIIDVLTQQKIEVKSPLSAVDDYAVALIRKTFRPSTQSDSDSDDDSDAKEKKGGGSLMYIPPRKRKKKRPVPHFPGSPAMERLEAIENAETSPSPEIGLETTVHTQRVEHAEKTIGQPVEPIFVQESPLAGEATPLVAPQTPSEAHPTRERRIFVQHKPRPDSERTAGQHKPRPNGERTVSQYKPRPDGERTFTPHKPRPDGERTFTPNKPRPDGERTFTPHKPRPEGEKKTDAERTVSSHEPRKPFKEDFKRRDRDQERKAPRENEQGAARKPFVRSSSSQRPLSAEQRAKDQRRPQEGAVEQSGDAKTLAGKRHSKFRPDEAAQKRKDEHHAKGEVTKHGKKPERPLSVEELAEKQRRDKLAAKHGNRNERTGQKRGTDVEEERDFRDFFPRSSRPTTRRKSAAKAAQKAQKAAVALRAQQAAELERSKVLNIHEMTTVKELAEKMNIAPAKIIAHLMTSGIMANVNQVLDPEAAVSLAQHFGFEVNTVSLEEEIELQDEIVDVSKLQPRPPVVTIMGHVDHGKTTLLDAIRESKITDTEFGGITQHIGAYAVEIRGQRIVFLDTPGHEAFTAMRARGAKATDAVVLVVAADDGIMPQTIEAIDHARAAKVPIIVAINKIDVPGSNPDRVMQELTKYGLTPEDWGGDTICVKVSAKQRTNLDDLLEMILLQAEILELKADPERLARGVIVEALLDKGRGPVATVLVQKGTLRVGDPFVVGSDYGKVRAMLDDFGNRVEEAGPSTPVEVLGLAGVPTAGDAFIVVDSERKARQISESRKEEQQKIEFSRTAKITLEGLHHHLKEGQTQELRIVIKADVHGSVEALTTSLEKLSTEQVRLQVIHGGVGAINESDVILASASNAIILGFNVKPVVKALDMAEKEQIDVRLYNVIYQAIDDVKKAMEGLLAPVYNEVQIGQAQVMALFSLPRGGTVAGCRVLDGKITRNAIIRQFRNNAEIFKGSIASLRRVKDDVREVLTGFECGIRLEGRNDVKEGDILRAFTTEKVTITLEEAAARSRKE